MLGGVSATATTSIHMGNTPWHQQLCIGQGGFNFPRPTASGPTASRQLPECPSARVTSTSTTATCRTPYATHTRHRTLCYLLLHQHMPPLVASPTVSACGATCCFGLTLRVTPTRAGLLLPPATGMPPAAAPALYTRCHDIRHVNHCHVSRAIRPRVTACCCASAVHPLPPHPPRHSLPSVTRHVLRPRVTACCATCCCASGAAPPPPRPPRRPPRCGRCRRRSWAPGPGTRLWAG